jgi:hypothetical protein
MQLAPDGEFASATKADGCVSTRRAQRHLRCHRMVARIDPGCLKAKLWKVIRSRPW